MIQKKTLILISLITLIGFFIRAESLNLRSFWFDEAFSYFISNINLPNLIQATAADNHPPLYYILLHFWLYLGKSEIILRSLSLIFGVLTIPLIFFIGTKLHSQKAGLLSAVILSFSPLNVYYSQETRMYSLAIFLNLLMFCCFYSLLKKENQPAKIGYLFTTIIGLYTHYYFVISWLTVNFIFIIIYARNRKKIVDWLYLQILILLLYLPWMYVFQTNTRPQPWRYPLSLALPATFFAYAIGGLVPNNLKIIFLDSPHQTIKLVGIFLSLWMFFLFIYGLVKSMSNNKNSGKKKNILANPFLLASSCLLIPLGIVTFISFIYPIYSLKSLSIFSPFYYLAIAIAVIQLNPKYLRNAVTSILIVLSSLILFFMHTSSIFLGNPFREVASPSVITYQPGDAIAHSSIYSYYAFRYYHNDKKIDYLIFQSGLSPNTIKEIGGEPVPIEKLEASYNRIWLIGITFLSPAQDFQSIINYLSYRYELARFEKYDNIEIYLFDLKKT